MMQDNTTQINQLLSFKSRDKFSEASWKERGLNPSEEELCIKMTKLFDDCTDKLIAGINSNASRKTIKSTLKDALSKFNSLDYDTEEREFIMDLFIELSSIVNVEIKDNLSRWMYGSLLNNIFKITRRLKPKITVETLIQNCTNCGIELETNITAKEIGIPDYSWIIGKCNGCNELNLLSPGPNIKQMNIVNYQWVETLSKEEYTLEEALTRMEQIKLFRK